MSVHIGITYQNILNFPITGIVSFLTDIALSHLNRIKHSRRDYTRINLENQIEDFEKV